MSTARTEADQWTRPTGVPGATAFGPRFEAVIGILQRTLTGLAASSGPDWYPPVMAAARIERAEYAETFPHLLGRVRAYAEQPTEAQPEEVVLAPAVCYNVFAEWADRSLDGLTTRDAAGYCYRHEATSELGRFRTFRMREFVAAGDARQAEQWRAEWLERTGRFFTELGVAVRVEAASDPFFGPGGRLLKRSQLEQQLKFEFVGRVHGGDPGTALASANLHSDHLGSRFAITLADGTVAHSSCMAFGLERIALALHASHGPDERNWPDALREPVLG